MKTNKFILAGLMAVGMLLSACTEEPPVYQPAAPEANEVQAYIYSDTKTSYQFVALEQSFPVVIGRNQTEGEASFELVTNDTVGAFVVEPVHFAVGEKSTTVNVTVNLSYGESYGLTLMIPEELATAYGAPQVSINVLVDFTWVPMGSVLYASQWEGAQAEVAIEQAKEYTDAAGNLLFRLVSPYYYVSPTYCTVKGLHLQFLLDKDYNAVSLPAEGFVEMENTGYNWMYWVPSQYPDYCFFINEGNIYALGTLWTEGASLYGPVVEQWMWDNGYPGAVAE
jgi:hypothetical protein